MWPKQKLTNSLINLFIHTCIYLFVRSVGRWFIQQARYLSVEWQHEGILHGRRDAT